MLTPDFCRTTFDAGLAYDDYVATGKPNEQSNWRSFAETISLTDAQRTLVGSFTRRLHVLVSSGTWCGDCVQQVPILRRLEEASGDRVVMRIVDRDEHKPFAERVRLCGGMRVPVVVLLNEDFELLGLMGDRTLSRYRQIAAQQLGPSCPLPGAPLPPEHLSATVQDWADELERAHLMARLSPRLREKHGD